MRGYGSAVSGWEIVGQSWDVLGQGWETGEGVGVVPKGCEVVDKG